MTTATTSKHTEMLSKRTLCGDQRGISLLIVLVVLLLIILAGFVALNYGRWEGQSPTARFDRNFRALGRNPSLALHIEDAGSGLKHVSVLLKHGGQELLLAEEQFSGPSVLTFWKAAGRKSLDLELGKLLNERYKVREGPASLIVTASDSALRNLFRGNQLRLQHDFAFDLYPPRLEVLSGQHYINQGGSECVVYRVSPDASRSGIQVGPFFFPGYDVSTSNPDVKFSLCAFPYHIPENNSPKVVALDEASNEAVAGFWYKLFPKKFRNRDITLEDSFLRKVVPEIMSRTKEIQDQGDPVKTFVEINGKLRRFNHEVIARLSRSSPPRFLWNGAFLQLSNSKVESLFADHRTYVYQGKEVDRQDHVGFDLSVVQQYPIEAANDGVVVYADYLGIYGNTVLVDHGCGLLSLYGHLSSIDVKTSQQVKKKEVLGRSGQTGLAGGDHLHFGMFLHGVPVNPTEWWDEKWIKDHVLDRLGAVQVSTTSTANYPGRQK